MGLFDFFRAKKSTVHPVNHLDVSLMIQGPGYIRNLLQPVSRQIDGLSGYQPETQFVGKLVTAVDSRFRLKYFGDLSTDGLIIDQGEAPLKVIAIGEVSGQQTVLFDKSLHGWAGFITGAFRDQQLPDRNTLHDFSANSLAFFQIYLVAYYSSGTKSELIDASVDGIVQIASGEKIVLQAAFDDAFDVIEIFGIDDNGKTHLIVSEELA